MMPDLGRYAIEVTLAYVVSLAMLAALIGWIWARTHHIKRTLRTLETRLTRISNG